MKKCILFVILEPYADWEAAYLSSALQMLGQGMYEVKTVSLTKEPVCSIGGFCVLPDYDINSIPADYEALILVGEMPGERKSFGRYMRCIRVPWYSGSFEQCESYKQ